MAAHDDLAVVVGAGVSGLTTAICLAEAGWSVRVWAAEQPSQTTSIVAGALWGPAFQAPVSKTLAWTETSLHTFQGLARDPHTGVRMAPALTVGDLPPDATDSPQVQLIPDLKNAEPTEVPDGYAGGYRSTMPLIDMPHYLDYLTGRLAAAGTTIETFRMSSLSEAAAAAPVVVNCAGLGARELAGDHELRPNFGQHVVVTNPGLDQVVMELSMNAEWTSYFPHPERIVCGGVSVPDRGDVSPDPAITERILNRCRMIEPLLHDAEIVETVAGLRPDRPSIRLEVETDQQTRYIHNYGHGGNGVSLSWGCAQEVLHLLGR